MTPPAAYRVPNPPPRFVGRNDELRWLAEARTSTSLVVIAGPDGVGKTSLVLRHLSDVGVEDEAFFLSVRPGDPLEDVLRNLLWALAGDRDSIDAALLAREPEQAIFKALELADEAEATVVIDDLGHVAETEGVADLLIQLARFARSSRWLVTTKKLPSLDELQGRAFVLEGLAERELVELGEKLSPHGEADSLRRAVAASGGSPWVFKQHLLSGVTAVDSARDRVLAGLGDDALSLLGRMARLRLALPLSVLAPLAAKGDAEPLLTTLARRGLVVLEGAGFRAHDTVRGLLRSDRDLDVVAKVLGAAEEPRAWLEALRLHLRRGDLEAALGLMRDAGQILLARGEAPRLWKILSGTPDERLRLWRIRCASELGHATVLAAVGPPRLDTPEEMRDWARMLHLQGVPAEALDVIARARKAGLEEDAETADLEARCLIATGRADEAIERLRGREGAGALLRYALSVAKPDAAAPPPPDAPTPAETVDLARAAFHRGERDQAARLLDLVAGEGGSLSSSLVLGREAALLRIRLDLAAGRLDGARARLDELQPFMRGPTLLRPMWMLLNSELRIATGEVKGLEESLEQALTMAKDADHLAVGAIERAATTVARLEGKRMPTETGRLATPSWYYDAFGKIEDCRRELWSGKDVSDSLSSIARHAAEDQLALVECEALNASCEAALATGEAHLPLAERLLERAETIQAHRQIAAGHYYLGLDRPSFAEQAAFSAAPCASRRARSRLGVGARLNQLDQLILSSPSAFKGSVETLGDGEEPAWGLWDAEKVVWLPDGREIDFSRRPLLYRLLTTIFDAGGEADKENLILDVWEEREYHPIRHNPKLFVAIRTIRAQLEEQKSSPEWLLTSDEGYALRLPIRRVR